MNIAIVAGRSENARSCENKKPCASVYHGNGAKETQIRPPKAMHVFEPLKICWRRRSIPNGKTIVEIEKFRALAQSEMLELEAFT